MHVLVLGSVEAATRGLRRRNTVVGGKCALPSALLVIILILLLIIINSFKPSCLSWRALCKHGHVHSLSSIFCCYRRRSRGTDNHNSTE